MLWGKNEGCLGQVLVTNGGQGRPGGERKEEGGFGPRKERPARRLPLGPHRALRGLRQVVAHGLQASAHSPSVSCSKVC